MASVIITLVSKIYKDGTSPVFLKFIINRKQYTKGLVRVKAIDFDKEKRMVKPSCIHHVAMNRIIIGQLRKAERYFLDRQDKKLCPNPEAFFNGYSSDMRLTVAIEEAIEGFEVRKMFRSADKFRTTCNKVVAFTHDPPIDGVNSGWLRRFDAYLTSIGNNPNTRGKDLGNVQTVLSNCIKDGLITNSPFVGFKMPSLKAHKVKFTRQEFEALMNVGLTVLETDLARDAFVFASLQRGLRAYDVMTLIERENVQNGRLVIQASKVSKMLDMKLTEHAAVLIDKYRGQSPYVFPILKLPPRARKKDLRGYLKAANGRNVWLNKTLKKAVEVAGIEKHVTMHCARHTFA
jgi:site-specific recombinase XerD